MHTIVIRFKYHAGGEAIELRFASSLQQAVTEAAMAAWDALEAPGAIMLTPRPE